MYIKMSTLTCIPSPGVLLHRWWQVLEEEVVLLEEHQCYVEPNAVFHSSYFSTSHVSGAGLTRANALATSAGVTNSSPSPPPPFAPVLEAAIDFKSPDSSFVRHRRRGPIAISLHKSRISLPDHPSRRRASAATSSKLVYVVSVFGEAASFGFCQRTRPERYVSSRARLPSRHGSGTRMRFSSRRSMAGSRSHGRFDAASRKTCGAFSRSAVSPSIWIKISVFSRRDPSCSSPPPRALMTESNSSMKIVDGAWCRARSNSTRASFSDSPRHLLTIVLADTLKKVTWHSVATAFASMVFPVPGGPKSKIPRHGDRMPVKRVGYFMGRITASFTSCFGRVSPTMSGSKRTFGFFTQMSRSTSVASSRSSEL
mmetsp:Transcript_403/g.823  ORF Transcript_403/g.823 Transcript_403/m.823 type:complete len:369 (+) Transcript_403:194-1300(+)